MSESKGLGSKLLGIFVESGAAEERVSEEKDEGGEKSAAELVAELAASSAPGRPPTAPPPARAATGPIAPPAPATAVLPERLPPAPPAEVDFDATFRSMGMDASELDRVRKAEDLLKSLPEGTPEGIKKQIVEASLKAFGFEIAKISEAAVKQHKALETYVRLRGTETAKALQDAEGQISQLSEKIASLRAEIEKRTLKLSGETAAAMQRKAQVQKVLDFFPPPPAAS